MIMKKMLQSNFLTQLQYFEEAIRRLEVISGEKVIDGIDPFQVGICGLYDENNEAIFEL